MFAASSGTNPYNVFIGVAGGAGVTGGYVTVNVTVQYARPREPWAERSDHGPPP